MSPEAVVALVVLGLITGLLIGTVGVGGVLLVPGLVLIGGLDVHEATPIATASFLFTGLAGTVAYQRQGRIRWEVAGWLVVAAIPGAILGAVANVSLPAPLITIVVAAALATAAWQAFRGPTPTDVRPRALPTGVLLVVGAAVGFGSTLSGTGGPVLLIPIMILAGSAVALAVSSSQPIQIPIAVFGAASFLAYGALDWRLAIALGLAQAAGAVGGAIVGNRLPTSLLRTAVGWALALSAAVLVTRLVAG